MMTTNEMKNILVQKFKDEKCSFSYKDISIKKVENDIFHIIIKDYEHIIFRLVFEYTEDFGFETWVEEWYKMNNIIEYDHIVTMTDSRKNYDVKNALIHLGYYIANTF